MNNEVLKRYFKKFNEFPPKFITTNYDSDEYQLAMKQAIENNEKLTEQSLSKFITKSDLDFSINKGDDAMETKEEKLRNLLRAYGAEDDEIENFMHDLLTDIASEKQEDEDKFDAKEIILKHLKEDFNYDNDKDLQNLALNRLK